MFCFSLYIMLSYFPLLPIVFYSLMQMLLCQSISVLGYWLSSRAHSRWRYAGDINSAPSRGPYCCHSNKYSLTPSLPISLSDQGLHRNSFIPPELMMVLLSQDWTLLVEQCETDCIGCWCSVQTESVLILLPVSLCFYLILAIQFALYPHPTLIPLICIFPLSPERK